MRPLGHLQLERLKLIAGQEWSDAGLAWRFVRCDTGAAYWLGLPKARFFNEGEVIILAPGSSGIVRASQLNEVVLDHFKFAPELLGGFLTLAEQHALSAAPKGLTLVQFLPSTHPFSQRFAGLIRAEEKDRLTQRAELLELAVRLVGASTQHGDFTEHARSSAEGRFEEIISKMPGAELLHYSTAQLAQLCGCSLRHFHRLFQRRFGQSPRTRQTELRLLKSRQLLGSTNQEIAQVARNSGYRSLSLFNSLFKRRFGVSPSAWREQVRTSGSMSKGHEG